MKDQGNHSCDGAMQAQVVPRTSDIATIRTLLFQIN